MTLALYRSALLFTHPVRRSLSFMAGALYVLHGFSGVRGHDDWLLALPGVPGSIALPFILDTHLEHANWFNIIMLPWLLNSALSIFVYFATPAFTSAHSPAQAHAEPFP